MLEIGSIVDGKYKILNVIGKGGMSVVYLAMNERANKQWAIKEVRKDGIQNYEVVKQNLIVETDLLKKFNHPHLPSIIDVIDGDGTFLIVMDYIEGNPLSKALETSGAQSQEDVIEWAKQLCDVLGYLHSRKPPVIYRDMKPSNVMLKPDGNVMLIDFGTAREFKSTSVADTTCLGTQGYAAPEQFGGHGQTDARTDIYCLGATMYHLVTGHNPCTPPYEMYPIRQWNPMLSSGLEEIILKCTQRNPEDRYSSCAELLYALDHYTDLDIENKKVQSLKWKTFLVSIILSVVMLLATITSSVALSVSTSSTYDYYMEQANQILDEDQKAQLYKNAIDLNPESFEAYDGLLDAYYRNGTEGADDYLKITQSEYEGVVDVMNKYESRLVSADRQRFADDIALKIGDLLFMRYYSGDGNESRGPIVSAGWYKKVKENTNNEVNRNRAELLEKLAENFQELPSRQMMNDDEQPGIDRISPQEYWDDLEQLINLADIEKNDYDPQTPLTVYLFCLNEINSCKGSFVNEGLESEIVNALNHIKDNILKIKETPDYGRYAYYQKQTAETEEMINSIEGQLGFNVND